MFLSNFSQKPEYFSERSKDVFAENFSNFLFPFLHTCLCPTFHIERLLNIRLVRHKLRKLLNVVINTILGFITFHSLQTFRFLALPLTCHQFVLIACHCLSLSDFFSSFLVTNWTSLRELWFTDCLKGLLLYES